ncbi:glutaminyl-tRNA synthase (glutamine-hydrolyzing) subunit B [Candidatus Falkowbacteria bacterium RIFOXYB2_FULL_34_18]|uniref:Aspartyl/glutamyl-tRNA(Asn/Gln) amidotransferase subunit B n=1 Tax=Candidatus Falkowbacteria bacterium RIFOXYD2_FULL_34_120 TaxID=1798007 RepID=A0A1F5TRX7_9BACT|nr:MAG: glutaminyl-tRNA synthase (glutamine-hydrolyzing) subunit B [Candidatus Falkowbacteria bacterium RIFOXYB2_FULL_34_18]OGF29689.1 MAG: glutaminyl-tRNA synthase (glutamine-hydrolyzing) subunit B [Candidatus Falkowbacteria bacterium RIFOXYC12_FULL_34_55]OGF37446.1 MAG: glutaminyl-tRNA synthase (glutamine-hydrolyzing) subunit B [Candidatus Falkowbacteria bacterium RIFOXYC2_FULL_34_220]OGF39171.1 MAG: glutaminyl-tRNA synthase (glutamine-hydrolyzing) subunit B [Candidatus Falkowbacteria bacteriu
MKYDVIIGLEIHAELNTKSKMFCACNNNIENKKANANTCPICLGHPGTLPVPNKEAVESTILTGLALNCKINQITKFDRKNYFYPDLPKGYQISQLDLPICYDGHINIDDQQVKITRIHLEEDTGKSTHPSGKDYSLLDFNRAGTPLMEMVTEPTIPNAEIAKKFCQTYQQILQYLKISDANMEKGEMRCEANISLQEKGKWKYKGNCEIVPIGDYKLNKKTEVKNINSFRALEKAINYEIERQAKLLDDGEKILQETRGWNDDQNKTISQRIKETSADYRYFPEPDIPSFRISSTKIEEIQARLIEMPHDKKKRFMEQYDFSKDTAELLVSDKNLAHYAENVISELRAWIDSTGDSWERQKKKLAKITSNWLTSELLKHLKNDKKNIKNIKITPENFAELLSLIYQDKINSSAGQSILEIMYKNGGDPTDIMKNLGLEQLDDEGALKTVVKEIIEKNPNQTAEYRSGKENILQFFVGQAMAATKGKANPKKLIELFKELL